jgi:hypothetical protein
MLEEPWRKRNLARLERLLKSESIKGLETCVGGRDARQREEWGVGSGEWVGTTTKGTEEHREPILHFPLWLILQQME